MPFLPYSIELHDSDISAIEYRNGAAVVVFSHAYIHKDGKGWSQHVELVVHSATIETNQYDFPAKVDDGTLETKLRPYRNLLILPLTTIGRVDLKIKFISGNHAFIRGTGIDVVFTSEAVFIENVSFT